MLNNLRLLIQPYIYGCLLSPWLALFPLPGLREGFGQLLSCMNGFSGFLPV